MVPIKLSNVTGVEQIDRLLCGLIGLLEIVFPEQARGYYVTGSYGDGTAVETSDLDFVVVFKGGKNEAQRKRLQDIRDHLFSISPILIDLGDASEDEIFRYGHRIGMASLFVFGEDIRAKIPLVPMDVYLRRCLQAPIFFMTQIVRRLETCAFPLDYPDPAGEFYGYDDDGIENKKDTKVLMAIVGNIATAIVALKAKVYVRSKLDCLRLYQQHIHDEWTDLITDVYQVFRNQWAYRIPEGAKERDRLRAVCKRTVDFENYFLACYRDFLIGDLSSAHKEHQLRALRGLSEIVFPEQNVLGAVRGYELSEDEDLRQAACGVIGKITLCVALNDSLQKSNG